MSPITVFVADDQPIIHEGIKIMLQDDDVFIIIGHARKLEDLEKTVVQIKPHLILLDLNFKGQNASPTCGRLKTVLPDVKIIIFSSHNTQTLVEKAFQAGADGFILKDMERNDLIEAFGKVLSGKKYIGKGVYFVKSNDTSIHFADKLHDGFDLKFDLSKRELEVLRLIVMGYSSEQMAESLYISKHTVQDHRKNILRKLNCHSEADVVRFAYENQLI